VLAVAVEWGCLRAVPKFHMEKVPKKLATYVSGEHFAAIYTACDKARSPRTFRTSARPTGGGPCSSWAT
jgi:hypothetical protein